MNEQDFARIVKDCVDMGAALVGGCCGTTPGYIAQLKKML
jgi:5-methyltetrahydrofolate--homocysteine methyltransferase